MTREEAIEFGNMWLQINEDCKDSSTYVFFQLAIKALEQELKTGHWIGIDEEPHEDYECNNCGYTISTYTANIEPHTEYRYCPNCGADMREVEE